MVWLARDLHKLNQIANCSPYYLFPFSLQTSETEFSLSLKVTYLEPGNLPRTSVKLEACAADGRGRGGESSASQRFFWSALTSALRRVLIRRRLLISCILIASHDLLGRASGTRGVNMHPCVHPLEHHFLQRDK
jgi:hypothetical protein